LESSESAGQIYGDEATGRAMGISQFARNADAGGAGIVMITEYVFS